MAREPQIGDQLGHYRLVELLAVGGMGVIFKAYDEPLGRHVAVKVLSPKLAADGEFAKRFLLEARAVANLNHPNIIQMHYISQQDGLLFFAMELVAGQNLDALVRQQKVMPARDAAGLIRQAAVGLRHAHKRGVIHRDIKPTNVMINADGVVKLTDFGLAKNLKTDSAAAAPTESFFGTPDYMSPEEATGLPVDHRSDIYSLGATFYHLLAGRPPFTGATPQAIIKQHVSASPPPVTQFNRAVPPPLIRIINKMLAKKPAARYQDYDALVRDLEAWLNQPRPKPAPAPSAAATPPPTEEPEAEPPPSHPWEALIAAGLLAALVFGIWWYDRNVKRAPAPSPTPAVPGITSPPRPVPPSPDPGPASSDLEQDARAALARLRQRAEAKIAAGNFGEALSVFLEWPQKFEYTEARQTIKLERRRIRDLARQAWTETSSRALELRTAGQPDQAQTLYEQSLVRFQGITEIEVDIREQLRFIRQQLADHELDDAVARLAAERERETRFQQLTAPVSNLILSLQFEKAQIEARRLTAANDPAAQVRLDQLRADVDRLAALKQVIIARIMSQPPREITLTMGAATVQGHIIKATADELVMRRRIGEYGYGEVNVVWATLAPASALKVITHYLDTKNADELLAYALLLTQYATAQQARVDDARLALRIVAQVDASRSSDIDPALARLRDHERLQRERDAGSLWNRLQQSAVRQDWDAVERDLAILTADFADTDLVKIEKRRALQQLAGSAPRP